MSPDIPARSRVMESSPPRWKRRLLVAALVATATATAACRKTDDGASAEATEGEPEGVTPVPKELPPLELRADTPDLLLTWLDDQGDFHVVQRVDQIPEAARSRVRVVITSKREGTGDRLYVADLTKPRADGTYAVGTMPRSEWDGLGAEKRKKRLEALAPSARPVPPPPETPKASANGRVSAVIYGADWCGPCHQAEDLLRGLGVDVVKKDIEQNPAAGDEMRRKLRKAGRGGGSIPVIDLAGKLFVGFDGRTLRKAVADAKRGETL